MKISFQEDKYANSNIALSGFYLLRAVKHLGLSIADLSNLVYNRVVKRYPLTVIIVIAATTFVWSFIEIGKARAERDRLSKEMYEQGKILERYETAYGVMN